MRQLDSARPLSASLETTSSTQSSGSPDRRAPRARAANVGECARPPDHSVLLEARLGAPTRPCQVLGRALLPPKHRLRWRASTQTTALTEHYGRSHSASTALYGQTHPRIGRRYYVCTYRARSRASVSASKGYVGAAKITERKSRSKNDDTDAGRRCRRKC